MSGVEGLFTDIYARAIWGKGSGAGSDPGNVAEYVAYLKSFLVENNIRSIVDCGCGDWQIMRCMDLEGIDYVGFDVVQDVIERNRQEFGRPGVRFELRDFTEGVLPSADLVLCKDVLQHLPDKKVFRFLSMIERFRYALITNDVGDNRGRGPALAATPYHFAPIDLCAPPFNLRAREVCRTMICKSTLLRTRAPDPGVRDPAPRVLLAILAKQKEAVLPLFLRCIDALDYPKSRISLWVRTNNNTDGTASLLRDWLARVGGDYEHVHFDESDVDAEVQRFGVHEWNAERFRVLAALRQQSLSATLARGCDYYFVVDVDNFIRPMTLRALMEHDCPIVAPLLHHEDLGRRYANFHFKADRRGYYQECEEYDLVLLGQVRGLIEVDVVHCTYLVRSDSIQGLNYIDASGRHEYVVFSESARRSGVPQYLDNRQVYGWLSLVESAKRSEDYLDAELYQASLRPCP